MTIAVLLIRAGLNGPATTTTTSLVPAPSTTRTVATTGRTRTRTGTAAEYYTVESGDNFGSIAAKNGTTVGRLEQLNPGVSSNALIVGQRIRVK